MLVPSESSAMYDDDMTNTNPPNIFNTKPKSIQVGLIVVLLLLMATASCVAVVLPFMSQAPTREWYLRNNMCMVDQAAQACKKATGHFPSTLDELRAFLPGGRSVDGNSRAGEVRLMPRQEPPNPYSYKNDWCEMERFGSRTDAIAAANTKVSMGEVRYCLIGRPDGYMLFATDLSGGPLVWDSDKFNERADLYAKFNR